MNSMAKKMAGILIGTALILGETSCTSSPQESKSVKLDGECSEDFSSTNVIVTLEKELSSEEIDALASDFGLTVLYKYESFNMCALASPKPLSAGEMDSLIERLSGDSRVLSAEKDRIMHTMDSSVQ